MPHQLSLKRAPADSNDVGESLRSARDAVEQRFLQAGDVLAGAAEALGGLVGVLDRVVEGVNGESMADSRNQLQAAAGALMALPQRQAERLSTVADLQRRGRGLAGSVDDMERTLAYLQAYASSIKITAAGIMAANDAFDSFSHEIAQEVESGRTQLKRFRDDLTALLTLFGQAHGQEAGLADRFASLLPAVPDDLCANAQALESHHRQVADIAGQIAARGRSIQAKLGTALAGLQVGDMTRQRIEHAMEILAFSEATEGLSPDQRRRFDAFVHHLLASLLHSASEEFHEELERLGGAMEGLASEAGAILDLCDRALGREGGDTGLLRRLEGDVGRAQALIQEVITATQRACELGASGGETARALTRQLTDLQAIQMSVQYMALNTTLRCSRIGDAGKPLSVIALELRQHAGNIEVSAKSAQALLREVGDRAKVLTDAREDPEDVGSASHVGAILDRVTSFLRQMSDQLEADLEGLTGQGASAAGSLRSAAASLDLKAEIGGVMDRAAAELDAQGDQDPDAVSDLEAPLGALLAKASARYTMAAERDVHARIVARLAFEVAEARPAAATEAEPAELEDVFF